MVWTTDYLTATGSLETHICEFFTPNTKIVFLVCLEYAKKGRQIVGHFQPSTWRWLLDNYASKPICMQIWLGLFDAMDKT